MLYRVLVMGDGGTDLFLLLLLLQFHRREYTVKQVKEFLAEKKLVVREVEEYDL